MISATFGSLQRTTTLMLPLAGVNLIFQTRAQERKGLDSKTFHYNDLPDDPAEHPTYMRISITGHFSIVEDHGGRDGGDAVPVKQITPTS
jgi:hypothetical protein